MARRYGRERQRAGNEDADSAIWIAGLFATAVYFASLVALVELAGAAPVPAALIATAAVIAMSYAVNRRFVFPTDRSHTSAFTRFAAASLLSIGVNATLMHVTTAVLAWPYLAGAVLTTVIVPVLNFSVNYFWAFRPSGGAQ